MANRYSDEALLAEIRIFNRRHRRPPSSGEYAPHFAKLIQRRFGSWEAGVQKAIGTEAVHHRWTDEEVLEVIRSLKAKHGRFPTIAQLRDLNESLAKLVRVRFGSLDEATEKAMGDSLRIRTFRSLCRLTPPGCDRATSSEVKDELRKDGIQLDVGAIANVLIRMKETGFVIGGRIGERSWWSPTAAGRAWLKRQSSQ